GVPVPWDKDHVFYVWYDALVHYLTAIGYGEDDERFARWWPAVHHLIGKEIIRFHCVWWPAMCMAAGIDPPADVFVHGWLLFGGEKLSKTMLEQLRKDQDSVTLADVAPELLTEDLGVDPIRYHLLRMPLGPDADFSYARIVARYNADLANNLGNLMSRVASVVASKCGGLGPGAPMGGALAEAARIGATAAGEAWDRFAPSEALGEAWKLIGAANAELEAAEPWKLDPGPEVDRVLGGALEVLRLVALLSAPAIPAAAAEIWRRIGLSGSPANASLPEDAEWGGYPGGLAVVRGDPLFPRRKEQ
ncbi:MAG: class I tRNA ligase family protein, partial [Acidimicrobiales bacterium]